MENGGGRHSVIVFLDFDSFDGIWRANLIFKMVRFGIDGPIVRLAASYIAGRSLLLCLNQDDQVVGSPNRRGVLQDSLTC